MAKPKTDAQAMRLARRDKRDGKAAYTQAGEFVHEEMEHLKEGKHSGRHPIKSPKQAVAIGLSKARKHGIKVPQKSGRRSSQKKAA